MTKSVKKYRYAITEYDKTTGTHEIVKYHREDKGFDIVDPWNQLGPGEEINAIFYIDDEEFVKVLEKELKPNKIPWEKKRLFWFGIRFEYSGPDGREFYYELKGHYERGYAIYISSTMN